MGIDWPFDDGDDVAGDRTFVHLKEDHGYVFASDDPVWTDMALDRMHLDLHRRHAYGPVGQHTVSSREEGRHRG